MPNNHHMVFAAVAFFALLTCIGCAAADETTTKPPERTEVPSEAPPLGMFRPGQPSTPDTIGRSVAPAQLTSKQDTLTASVTQYTQSVKPRTPLTEENFVTAYTIQIGAFAEASNALVLLKRTKERFGEYPVLNRFEPRDRLYRVSIGLFETRERAVAFQQTLMKNHAPEFKDTWISQISK